MVVSAWIVTRSELADYETYEGNTATMAINGAAIVRNARNDQVLGTEVEEARGLWGSFKGLMFRNEIPDGYGLVFKPARGIHTNFMRFPIDLIYFDKQDRVIKVRPAMKPWKWDFTNAAGVIEMNPGSAARADVQPGDQLIFEPPA